ncbi:hypothetical protein PHMEG_0002790 [Phytophthora megakarya]|uniref:PX domain-containing protein n=1 Tax=Phytophthora megakarya TaxID=4795 RepID=A0A225WXK1_9STRA|nr:hypothetical protein PHMEG_0002790 [Phytophthora megakarya]
MDTTPGSNLVPFTPSITTRRGQVASPPSLESQPRLNPDAHRHWKANMSVEFLNKVNHIDILETRTDENRTVFYVLQVHLPSQSVPVLTVERRFSDFEELRHRLQSVLSDIPPCRCSFCYSLLAYLGFSKEQPRGIVKFIPNIDKRKKILAQFASDVVTMGRRRVEKAGKHACEKQLLIPVILQEFLVEKSGE